MKKLIVFLLVAQMGFGASFMTIPYNFVARQLISASKIMANYNALRNGMIDGSKKINVAEVWTNGSRIIDSAGNVTGVAGTFTGALTGTSGTMSGIVAINNNLTVTGDTTVVDVTSTGKITVPSANFTVLLQLTPQTTTPSTAITGDMFCNISGVIQGYNGTTWNATW